LVEDVGFVIICVIIIMCCTLSCFVVRVQFSSISFISNCVCVALFFLILLCFFFCFFCGFR